MAGGRVPVRPAQLRAQRLHKTGTALRVRPAGGQSVGAVHVARGPAQGDAVAGHAGNDDIRRGRAVRSVHVPDVPADVAGHRAAGAAVHQDAARPAAKDAPGLHRQALVQKSPDRVPAAQKLRLGPVRTTGSPRSAKAPGLLRPHARPQQRHFLLRRHVQYDVERRPYHA